MHNKKTIEEYVFHAENSSSQPQSPPGGIPKQWLFSWIRWPLRVLFLPFIWLDCFAQKIARFIIKPPYKAAGHCKKRGNCCFYILMSEPKGLCGRILYLWNTQVNGFFLRELVEVPTEKEKIAVMGCRYLQSDGSCKHHLLRPTVCREWPRIEYFDRPKILKGCGYKAIDRKTGRELKVIQDDKSE